MRKRNRLLMALGFAAAAALAAFAEDVDDSKFLSEVLLIDLAEIRMGQLAQQRGSTEGVRNYGAKLQADHTRALEKTTALAKPLGVPIPSEPSAEALEHYAALEKLSGPAFDSAFAGHMVMGHEKAIEKFHGADARQPEQRDHDVRDGAAADAARASRDRTIAADSGGHGGHDQHRASPTRGPIRSCAPTRRRRRPARTDTVSGIGVRHRSVTASVTSAVMRPRSRGRDRAAPLARPSGASEDNARPKSAPTSAPSVRGLHLDVRKTRPREKVARLRRARGGVEHCAARPRQRFGVELQTRPREPIPSPRVVRVGRDRNDVAAERVGRRGPHHHLLDAPRYRRPRAHRGLERAREPLSRESGRCVDRKKNQRGRRGAFHRRRVARRRDIRARAL